MLYRVLHCQCSCVSVVLHCTCAGLDCCPEWEDSESPVLMGGRSVFLLRGSSGDVSRSLAVGLWKSTQTERTMHTSIDLLFYAASVALIHTSLWTNCGSCENSQQRCRDKSRGQYFTFCNRTVSFENTLCKIGKCSDSLSCWRTDEKINITFMSVHLVWSWSLKTVF